VGVKHFITASQRGGGGVGGGANLYHAIHEQP
jgi:hypothetical protein